MSEIIQDTAKFLLTQSLYWASRNPLEAIAGTAIISNPTTRSLTFKIGGHLIKQKPKRSTIFFKINLH